MITDKSITDQFVFDTLQEALEWMETEVDDPCIDNFRSTPTNNDEGMIEYDQLRDSGCCGSFDTYVTINGQEYMVGCNYGH